MGEQVKLSDRLPECLHNVKAHSYLYGRLEYCYTVRLQGHETGRLQDWNTMKLQGCKTIRLEYHETARL